MEGPFAWRLRALVLGSGRPASELASRAIDLDANDAMNWLVHSRVETAGRFDSEGKQQFPLLRAASIDPDSALMQYEVGSREYSARGRNFEAKEAFDRAIKNSARHFRSYL